MKRLALILALLATPALAASSISPRGSHGLASGSPCGAVNASFVQLPSGKVVMTAAAGHVADIAISVNTVGVKTCTRTLACQVTLEPGQFNGGENTTEVTLSNIANCTTPPGIVMYWDAQ